MRSNKDHAVYSDLFSSKPKLKPEGYHVVCVQYVALSCSYVNLFVHIPSKDGGGFTISENLKSFEGPVLSVGAVESAVLLI